MTSAGTARTWTQAELWEALCVCGVSEGKGHEPLFPGHGTWPTWPSLLSFEKPPVPVCTLLNCLPESLMSDGV